ncbi:hypothetical protein [Cellulomonas phragmiteti]|uniref:Uncharacterized protein n=1 Tax=Cellulomonas phragmiteti TaxID=478780 RepID=A0ABQ4DQT5_9CELL|nr:hypothetical protein [Cellulomonas phragmiteti]GIG41347.1 hypothetical protein Cph01nite_31090 [Cellulomonas phragmiteti]
MAFKTRQATAVAALSALLLVLPAGSASAAYYDETIRSCTFRHTWFFDSDWAASEDRNNGCSIVGVRIYINPPGTSTTVSPGWLYDGTYARQSGKEMVDHIGAGTY